MMSRRALPLPRGLGLHALCHVSGDHVVAKHEQIGGADTGVGLQTDAEATQHVLETAHGLMRDDDEGWWW